MWFSFDIPVFSRVPIKANVIDIPVTQKSMLNSIFVLNPSDGSVNISTSFEDSLPIKNVSINIASIINIGILFNIIIKESLFIPFSVPMFKRTIKVTVTSLL